METLDIDVFFDFRSHRARACCKTQERVLPGEYRDHEAAKRAAVKLVKKSLLRDGKRVANPEIRVWLR